MDIRVTGQPTIVLGLVDVQVVQNDMQLLGGTMCHDAVHEAQELPPASSVVMSGVHQSRRHLQGGKQGGCAVTFIFMTEPTQGLTVGQPQPSLGTLQRLNGRFLVHTEDESIFRRVKVESNNI